MLDSDEKPVPDAVPEGEKQANAPAVDASTKSLKLQVTDLVDDARKLAEAEIEYYKTKLSVNLAATKTVLILFSLSVVVGITAVVALILGILLILSAYLGPIAATGILTGSALLIATVMMNIAIRRARKLPLDEDSK